MFNSLAGLSLFVLPFITMELADGTAPARWNSAHIATRRTGIVVASWPRRRCSRRCWTRLRHRVQLVRVQQPALTDDSGGFLGLFLRAAFLVVGLFISSLTRSQIVAGVGGLGAVLLLWLAGLLGEPGSTLGQALNELSLVTHFEDFSKGILDTKHIVFYLSFVFFGLFACGRSNR
jgi:hypothetical protein